jgi:excisionase family DNA binding protein
MPTSEAASALGVTVQRIRQLISSGRLSAQRLGARSWIVDPKSVASLLASRVKE